MPLFAATTFLSAFLLFQLQPLAGRILLPWFGGSAGVWTTCMVFFQALLLAGYAWAHLLPRLAPRRAALAHLGLLLVAVASLAAAALFWRTPLFPSWRPSGESPVLEVLLLLSMMVGPPFLALSATGPLLQRWASLQAHSRVYRLYAVSNAGSLLGLVTYPFVVEPLLTLRAQAWAWTAGFALFATSCAVLTLRSKERPAAASENAAPDGPAPGWGVIALWFALPAAASVLLLSVTGQMTLDVAPIPLLWIAPLAVYLVTFILCFESDRWYHRRTFLPLFGAAALILALASLLLLGHSLPRQAALHLAFLFGGCMALHGELARLRPSPRHLTSFYLAVAAGGALGAGLVGVAAPLLFDDLVELKAAAVLAWVPLLAALYRDRAASPRGRRLGLAFAALAMVATLGVFTVQHLRRSETFRLAARDFFGAVLVHDVAKPGKPPLYALMHGQTIHGAQSHSTDWQDAPGTYFAQDTGVGLALRNLPRPPGSPGLRVGIVGLGVGTLASFAQPGDTFRFYEISPLVVRLAQGEGGYFTYLARSKAKVEVVVGDGRLSLERELATGGPQRFDALVLDAYNSDAIPTHLLTREAMQLYLAHLAGPESVIVLQMSNRYIDLRGIAWRLARELGLEWALVERRSGNREVPLGMASTWMILSRSRAVLDRPEVAQAASSGVAPWEATLWTDDHSPVLEALKLR